VTVPEPDSCSSANSFISGSAIRRDSVNLAVWSVNLLQQSGYPGIVGMVVVVPLAERALVRIGRHQERAVLLNGRFQFEKPLAMVLFAQLHHRAEPAAQIDATSNGVSTRNFGNLGHLQHLAHVLAGDSITLSSSLTVS
jgi:hypothetical protein